MHGSLNYFVIIYPLNLRNCSFLEVIKKTENKGQFILPTWFSFCIIGFNLLLIDYYRVKQTKNGEPYWTLLWEQKILLLKFTLDLVTSTYSNKKEIHVVREMIQRKLNVKFLQNLNAQQRVGVGKFLLGIFLSYLLILFYLLLYDVWKRDDSSITISLLLSDNLSDR